MSGGRGHALLIEWFEGAGPESAQLERWYAEDELPRLARAPGVLAAGFFEAMEGQPRCMAVYELEDAAVLQREGFIACLHQRQAASPREADMRWARHHLRIGYRQIFPATNDLSAPSAPLAPYLQVGRMDIAAEREEEFNAWYDTAYIPPYQAVEGCLDARRFIAVDAQPRYLTLYALADAAIRHSPAWKAAKSSNPWSERFQPLNHGWGSPGVYRSVRAMLPT